MKLLNVHACSAPLTEGLFLYTFSVDSSLPSCRSKHRPLIWGCKDDT